MGPERRRRGERYRDIVQRVDNLRRAGVFATIGGQTRNKLAALSSSSSGNGDQLGPDLDGNVDALAVSGGNEVFVAGSFNTIGEDIQYKSAQFDSSGDLTPWNSAPDQAPAALATWGTLSLSARVVRLLQLLALDWMPSCVRGLPCSMTSQRP